MVIVPAFFTTRQKIMFIWSRAVCEGIMISLFGGLVSKNKPEYRTRFLAVVIVLEIVSVLSLYIFVENSSYFFWHPYIAFTLASIADLALYERGAFFVAGCQIEDLSNGDTKFYRGAKSAREAYMEKLLLWPLFVIPVISAFIMCTGWLIKLYWKNIFVFFRII